jgi:hypothetical protein
MVDRLLSVASHFADEALRPPPALCDGSPRASSPTRQRVDAENRGIRPELPMMYEYFLNQQRHDVEKVVPFVLART